MSSFLLKDLDIHIEALHAQLEFLRNALEKTDHRLPDWIAIDLLSLRNQSGKLCDDMSRFGERLKSEKLGQTKKTKRLSLENGKRPQNSLPKASEHEESQPQPSAPTKSIHPASYTTEPEQEHKTQHIDITDEVNRRLCASRLDRLMDSPKISRKRKFNNSADVKQGSEGDTEDDVERTPTKKLRASGTFEPALKIEHKGRSRSDFEDISSENNNGKRRRIWPSRAHA